LSDTFPSAVIETGLTDAVAEIPVGVIIASPVGTSFPVVILKAEPVTKTFASPVSITSPTDPVN